MLDPNSYCRHCRRQFQTPGQLLRHFSVTHDDDLRCKQCDTWFRYRSNLAQVRLNADHSDLWLKIITAQHLASPVHDEPSIPCPHCSRLLKTTSGVAHHLEFSCLKNVTEAVVRWDVGHQITSPVYTDRIQEIDSDEEEEDNILVPRDDAGLVKILDVLATELTWSSAVQAYVCPVPDCYQRFVKLGHLNQHLRSQKHRTDPSTFRCPKCESPFSVVSALIQHLESGSCGLAETQMVKEIYTGLHDMFKRLLKF